MLNVCGYPVLGDGARDQGIVGKKRIKCIVYNRINLYISIVIYYLSEDVDQEGQNESRAEKSQREPVLPMVISNYAMYSLIYTTTSATCLFVLLPIPSRPRVLSMGKYSLCCTEHNP